MLASDVARVGRERQGRAASPPTGSPASACCAPTTSRSLKPGFWVVFAGQYDSQSEASDALDGVDAKDAYIRRIDPN